MDGQLKNFPWKKGYFIFLGILLTFSYSIFYDLLYMFGPEALVNETEYALFDTIACLLLMLIYGLGYYFWSKNINAPFNLKLKGQELWQGIILGFSIGGFAFIWFMFVEWLLQLGFFPQTIEEFDQIWDYTREETFLWVFLSIAVLGPIVEELLFRGLIYRCFDQFNQPWIPIVVTSVLFGFWHQQPVQIGYTIMAGLVFAFARAVSGSIALPILIHIINNSLSTLPDAWDSLMSPVIFYLSVLAMVPALWILKQYRKQISASNLVTQDQEKITGQGS